MKILYDYQIFFLQKFGGISRYFCELMKHSQGLFDYSTGVVFSNNFYANELGFHKPFPIKKQFKGKWRLQKWLNERDSIKKTKQVDIIHPTYYDSYFIGKTSKPVVLTVYDMIHELFPNEFASCPNKKSLLECSAKIIAISQNTKKDILRFYPQIPQEKISVIYLGTSWDILGNRTLREREKRNYILFTGGRTFYKNF